MIPEAVLHCVKPISKRFRELASQRPFYSFRSPLRLANHAYISLCHRCRVLGVVGGAVLVSPLSATSPTPSTLLNPIFNYSKSRLLFYLYYYYYPYMYVKVCHVFFNYLNKLADTFFFKNPVIIIVKQQANQNIYRKMYVWVVV